MKRTIKAPTSRTMLVCQTLLILTAAAWLLPGCSVGPPSESTSRKVLENQIQSQSNGQIKLTSFKKTNGMGDNNFYQVEYEAQIDFLADGVWNRGNAMDPPSFEFSTGQIGSGATAQLLGSVVGAINVHRGQQTTVKSVLRFEKTEKGWRGQDGQVY